MTSDLMFRIIAADQTRAGFDTAGGNAEVWAKRNEAAARRASASMKMSGASVGNLAAQYQDVIIAAQMGQGAMTIGLQQGMQMAAVLGPMGAAGAVSGLGRAFLAILSPMSLVTIGLTTAAAAAIQYFTSVDGDAADADAALQRHVKQVDELAKRWGSSVPGLQEYAEVQKAIAQESADKAAAQGVTDQQWQEAANAAQAYIAALQQTQSELQRIGAENDQILEISDLFDQVTEAIDKHNLKAADLVALQTSVTAAFGTMGRGVGDYQAPLTTLLDTLGKIIGLNSQISLKLAMNNQVMPALDPLHWSVPPELAADEDKLQTARANATKSQWQIEQERLARAAGGPAVNPYESAVNSLLERTRALQAQTQAQAGLNPLVNDYGMAVAKAQQQTELLLAAEKAKMPVNDALKAQIDAQAQAYANVVAEQNKQLETVRQFQQEIEFAKSSSGSFLTTFRQQWLEGASAIDAAKGAMNGFLDSLATRLEQMAADKVITSLFGGIFGTTTAGGGLLSVLGGGNNYFPAAPALSTPVAAGSSLAAGKVVEHRVTFVNDKLNIRADVEEVTESTVARRTPKIVKAGIEMNNRQVLPGQVRKILGKSRDKKS